MSFINKLLDGAEIEWLPLAELARIKNGKDWKHLNEGDVPVYGSGGIMGYVDAYSYNQPTVLIPRKGSITNIFYVDTPFWNVDTIYYTEIDGSRLLPKYLYHFITTIDMMALDTGSGRPSLTQSILNEVAVPIPCPSNLKKSLEIQGEIVRILGTFTELTAELTARKRQYNYYRDQLLRFEDGDVEWKTLEEVTTSIASGRNKFRSTEGPYPVYGSTGQIGFTSDATYSGDVLLVARVGANCGRVNAVSGVFDVSDNNLTETYRMNRLCDQLELHNGERKAEEYGPLALQKQRQR